VIEEVKNDMLSNTYSDKKNDRKKFMKKNGKIERFTELHDLIEQNKAILRWIRF